MHQNKLGLANRLLQEVHPLDIVSGVRGYLSQKFAPKNKDYQFNPTSMFIELTYECNRRCNGCYVKSEHDEHSVINPDLIDRIFSEAQEHSITSYCLSGGEPMLPKTIPLLLYISSKNAAIPILLMTNGDYIARQGLGELVNQHNLVYCVSLDGPKPYHDSIRGPGSFNNVTQALQTLRRTRKLFGVSTTIRKDSIDLVSTPGFLELLSENHVKFVNFLKIKNTEKNHVSREEFMETKQKIMSFSKEYPLFVTFGGTGNGHAESDDLRYASIYVNPQGDVRVAKASVKTCLGNIRTEKLRDLILKANQEPQRHE